MATVLSKCISIQLCRGHSFAMVVRDTVRQVITTRNSGCA
jgi:hypothetical protein